MSVLKQFDPKIYDVRNLNENDRQRIDIMDVIKKNVLNNDIVDDFVLEKKIVGKTTRDLYRDILQEFIDYLAERVEYQKVDAIIDMIESYGDDDTTEPIARV